MWYFSLSLFCDYGRQLQKTESIIGNLYILQVTVLTGGNFANQRSGEVASVSVQSYLSAGQNLSAKAGMTYMKRGFEVTRTLELSTFFGGGIDERLVDTYELVDAPTECLSMLSLLSSCAIFCRTNRLDILCFSRHCVMIPALTDKPVCTGDAGAC